MSSLFFQGLRNQSPHPLRPATLLHLAQRVGGESYPYRRVAIAGGWEFWAAGLARGVVGRPCKVGLSAGVVGAVVGFSGGAEVVGPPLVGGAAFGVGGLP